MTAPLHLLIIDPQNDFCAPEGALSVPGADGDMDRLAAFLDAHRGEIDAITVSLDTHQRLDISHPLWFRDPSGAHPAPFTAITPEALAAGAFTTTLPEEAAHTLSYLRALEDGGRYPHVVWPPHCLAGTPGHNVWPRLAQALGDWEEARLRRISYVFKGINPRTEHFSALRAEVPLPGDPATQVNGALLDALSDAGELLVAGEALSHCVANTVRDLLEAEHGPPLARRITLLTDAMSSVPGFEDQGEAFLGEMDARGIGRATTGAWSPL